MRISPFLALAAFVALSRMAHAHHGLDFLVVQDAALPTPWSGMVYTSGEWSQSGSVNVYETESGVQLGITPWLAFGVSVGLDEEGDGWNFAQATPYANLSLFRSEAVPWLRVGLLAGYAFAEEPERRTAIIMQSKTIEKSLLKKGDIVVAKGPAVTPHSQTSGSIPNSSKKAAAGHSGGIVTSKSKPAIKHPGHGAAAPAPVVAPPPPPPKPEYVTILEPLEVVLPPEKHEGIHRHGEEGFTARLIVEADVSTQDKLIFNLIQFTPREGNTGWGYAIGYRHEFAHSIAASLEAIGDYDSEGYQQVVAAAHWSPAHALTLKLGVGAGLSDQTPDLSVHAGAVWRF